MRKVYFKFFWLRVIGRQRNKIKDVKS